MAIEKPADEERFRELILYISLQSEGDERFGVPKLNKLLYFIDAEALRQGGQTLTGQAYVKKGFGPVPSTMDETLAALEDATALGIRPRMTVGGFRERRPFALREPNVDLFTSRELCLIDSVLARYRAFTAKQCSLLSDRKYGWHLAAMGETIPISTELISERELTAHEMAYAQDLAGEPEIRELMLSGGR